MKGGFMSDNLYDKLISVLSTDRTNKKSVLRKLFACVFNNAPSKRLAWGHDLTTFSKHLDKLTLNELDNMILSIIRSAMQITHDRGDIQDEQEHTLQFAIDNLVENAHKTPPPPKWIKCSWCTEANKYDVVLPYTRYSTITELITIVEQTPYYKRCSDLKPLEWKHVWTSDPFDKSTTTTIKPTKGATMDSFDVNKVTDKVIGLACDLRKDDIDNGILSPSMALKSIGKPEFERIYKQIEQSDNLKAEQIVAVSSAVSLFVNDCTDEQVDEIVLKQSNENASTSSTTTTTSVMKEIPTAIATGINALGQTHDTKFDVNAMLKKSNDYDDLVEKSKELENEVRTLKTKATLVPTALSGDHEVDGTKLKYKVEMKKASDIFKNPKTGKAIAQLKFDIPTLVWEDDKGNVVKHPMCPDVDENYQFRATHLIKFLSAFILNKNVWCHGHTGTGKTTLPEQVASRIGYPLFPLNLDSQLERADLTGQTNLVQENGTTITKFEEGILPRAMVQPCFLVLDEIDAGKPDILFAIQRATEGKGLLLTEDGGRLVKPHPLFRFVATANSRGQGDETGVYAGVRPMNGALLNRFPMFIEVDYISQEEETQLLTKKYSTPTDVVKNLTEFAKLARKAFTSAETSVPVSPRDTMAFAEYFAHFSTILSTKTQAIEFAMDTAIISRSPQDNRQRLVELATRCFADCKFNYNQ